MIVTVDTNFLISATQWDYSVAHKLLLELISHNIKIVTTNEILDEFRKVLQRDFKYDKMETCNIMEKVLLFTTLVDPKNKIAVVEDDPDDDKIIECALESKSKYIITYDKHLLSLKEYSGIQIIRPEKARAIF
ncbi:putative toxin-antitoxin system toxin component, PIN family [Candidatus Woesearchaeota archaeon]|nr:putative toxin-antitoxin system toxin component, PIN family [Candidatus Woesearchaeota archaeon]